MSRRDSRYLTAHFVFADIRGRRAEAADDCGYLGFILLDGLGIFKILKTNGKFKMFVAKFDTMKAVA
jgi:hypothetical protein